MVLDFNDLWLNFYVSLMEKGKLMLTNINLLRYRKHNLSCAYVKWNLFIFFLYAEKLMFDF